MTLAALSEEEFSLPTSSSSTDLRLVATPETGRYPASCVVVQFAARAEELPDRYTDIDDVVREFERDPAFTDLMGEARQWAADNLYPGAKVTIRRLRLARGWSQSMLAETVGTSQSHIALIESGRADIRLTTLQKLAKALGVSTSDVVLAIESDYAPVE